MQTAVKEGSGLLIDSRMPQWYRNGTIPGAVNVPFTLVKNSATNPYLPKILQLLGAEKVNGTWNFDNAMVLTLFCNGPWCDQSPREIKDLLAAGYPANKLKYYRGGMQVWQLLGLTTVVPE
jgi:rhodanese-related sulfurtransferase